MPDPQPMQTEPLTPRIAGADGLLCVDLEDWYQIVLRREGRGARFCREQFRRGLSALLDVFDRHGAKATFFVLGMTVAEDPGVVRELAAAGHEIATHGYEHLHLEQRTGVEFEQDLRRAMGELAEITGRGVLGHRAPEFSVPRDDPQGFFDVLGRCGLAYDSSVYPIAGTRYGLPWFPPVPCRVAAEGGSLIELPAATVRWLGRRWPIAGGGSWRLAPRPLLRRAMRRALRQGVLLTTYMHNYEFDPRPLDLAEVLDRPAAGRPTWAPARRANLFRGGMTGKLDDVLSRWKLVPCERFLRAQGWLAGAADRPPQAGGGAP
jgi:polysaccharide deacetylase family protein (PEP-CTERM system associated)